MHGPLELKLEAFDGWPIPNRREPTPSDALLALARRTQLEKFERKGATRVAEPSGAYNCHGLTFGCRRTNIDSPDAEVDIQELLRHDAYERVSAPKAGDVIVYRLGSAIHHSGVVLAVDSVGTVPVVRVWSKWGSMGEYVHNEVICPYEGVREYWRARR